MPTSTTELSSSTNTRLDSSPSLEMQTSNEHADLTNALMTVSNALQAELDIFKASMAASETAVDFFNENFKGRLIYRQFVPLYTHLYETLFISTREELELYFRKRQFEPNLLNVINEFRSIERSWDLFLTEVDEQLYVETIASNGKVQHRIDTSQIRLTDCEHLHEVTLNSTMNPRIGKMTLLVLMRFFGSPYCLDLVKAIHDRAREFELHLCNVSIVCRGSREGGLKWRKLTGINFPVLADEHRDFITSLQFKQSVFQLSSSNIIHKMTSDMVRKKSMIALDQAAVEDPLVDFYQMGGAVLIDNQEGILLYIHQSETIDDLPSVDLLLETIARSKSDGRLRSNLSVKKVILQKSCASRFCVLL